MKRQRLLTAILTMAVILSGCTSLSLDSDLLSAPKASGSLAEIQSMIEEDADGSCSLIYPAAGDHKNGVILHDLNGDGTDEAIALYTTADGSAHILAAKKDGSYRSVGSTALHSENISSVRFADIDADHTEELVISFDIGSALSALEAFRVDGGIVRCDVAEGFSDFILGDFDGNSATDVLIFDIPSGESAQAHLMTYADGAFSEKSACDIDPAVISYASVRFDTISEDISAAIAEGKLSDGACATQLLYYDSAAHLLVNPLYMNSSYSRSKRTAAVVSTDIDEDGVIEVPVCTLMDHTKKEDVDAVCDLVHWCGYDTELMDLSVEQTDILCDRLGFTLRLSAERLAVITARYTADNAVTLYQVTYNKNSEPILGKEQLTVKRYLKSSFDSSLTAEAELYDDGQYIYTYILGEKSPFTHEEIETSFKPMEADTI